MENHIVTLDRLSLFKTLHDSEIATSIANAEAQSLHSVAISGQQLKFYKETTAEITSETVPAFSITLPTQDLNGFIEKIASATGGKIAQTKADGTIEESLIAISDLETKAHAGTIPNGATATNIVDYAKEYADGKVSALNTSSDVVTASKSGNTVTLTGSVKETSGIIAKGTASDITLADVASTGAAADVSYDNAVSGLTATDVKSAIDEIASASAGGVDSKKVHLADESAGQSAYAKVYKIYQGADDSNNANNTLIGEINIPKDLVVQSGSVVYVENGTDTEGASVALADGTYIKFVIQNQTQPLYINVEDLADIYTGSTGAQIVVSISSSNVISASLVAGSISATELASNAVTTAKITDENVTYAKLAPAVQASLTAADTAVQPADLVETTEAEIRALFSSQSGA